MIGVGNLLEGLLNRGTNTLQEKKQVSGPVIVASKRCLAALPVT
jgi:hypothetical protein